MDLNKFIDNLVDEIHFKSYKLRKEAVDIPDLDVKKAYEFLLNDLEDFKCHLIDRIYTYKSNIELPKTYQMRKPIPKGIRFEVFKRDNYTCKECNKSKKTHNIALEIDHIMPVSKGGTDEINNLQTLCYNCNRNKSDLIIQNFNKIENG